MAQVAETVAFITKADQVKFITQTNGDELYVLNLKLNQAQATSMAWLVNSDEQHELQFRVRLNPG